MGDIIYGIFADPFVQMWQMPDFLMQVLWEGFVAGILYALIALGFVLISKHLGSSTLLRALWLCFPA